MAFDLFSLRCGLCDEKISAMELHGFRWLYTYKDRWTKGCSPLQIRGDYYICEACLERIIKNHATMKDKYFRRAKDKMNDEGVNCWRCGVPSKFGDLHRLTWRYTDKEKVYKASGEKIVHTGFGYYCKACISDITKTSTS